MKKSVVVCEMLLLILWMLLELLI